MTDTLRHRLDAITKRCSNPRERRNGDGSFTVDGSSWVATRDLVVMVPEIKAALYRLEELEKKG